MNNEKKFYLVVEVDWVEGFFEYHIPIKGFQHEKDAIEFRDKKIKENIGDNFEIEELPYLGD